MGPTQLQDYVGYLNDELDTGSATEHSHRPALKLLVEGLHEKRIQATNEPTQVECGAPDFVIFRDGQTIGYIEAKDVGTDLNRAAETDQLERYRDSLESLLLTNYVDFKWYIEGELHFEGSVGEYADGKVVSDSDASEDLLEVLRAFLSRDPQEVSSPDELAARMADLTHLMRAVIENAFDKDELSNSVQDLFEVFNETIIPSHENADDVRDFADMYAQTLCYGLFAARVNQHSSQGDGQFTRLSAAHEIPRTNPLLRTLFDLVTGPNFENEPYSPFVDDLVQLFNNADFDKVLEGFGEEGASSDPILHFYETFLEVYDSELKIDRGVFYTPDPVVDYIVQSVDELLEENFNLRNGLANRDTVSFQRERLEGQETVISQEERPKVLVLDPACGTGTFLYNVVSLLRDKFRRQNNQGMWGTFVADSLLPRLLGFELLMSPYAISHMRIGMQLAGKDLPENEQEDLEYQFDDDQRLNLFLNNTLRRPDIDVEPLRGPFRELSNEAKNAAEVKQNFPILTILGNPPYSNFGQMNHFDWILDMVRDWKPSSEKKWNPDDFMKFMRWGQWKLDRTGQGILAFITNRVYLDGISHRGMRESLLESFSDIYIVDLHGGRHERVPEDDENVFDITNIGVAIGIFVKEDNSNTPADVHHVNHVGSAEEKFDWLSNNTVSSTDWNELQNVDNETDLGNFYFFTDKAFPFIDEYEEFWAVNDIFNLGNSGVETQCDGMAVKFSEDEVEELITDMENTPPEKLRDSRDIKDDGRDWSLSNAVTEIREADSPRESITRFHYKALDYRYTWHPGTSNDFMAYPRIDISRPFTEEINDVENRGLVAPRQTRETVGGLVTNAPTNHKAFSAHDKNQIYPLYLPPTSFEEDFGEDPKPNDNFNKTFIRALENATNLDYSGIGRGDLSEGEFGAEQAFDYIYAFMWSDIYRNRYKELMRIDHPRIPLPPNSEALTKISQIGAELSSLHLLEITPPSSSMPGFPVDGTNYIDGYPSYNSEQERVYINDHQYFEGISEEVWNYEIGGHQVAHTWLKERSKHTLSSMDEFDVYRRIIGVVEKTIELTEQLDELLITLDGFPLNDA